MSSQTILLINALLFSSVFIFYVRKYKVITVGLAIWSLYAFSAWASFLFSTIGMYQGCFHDTEQHLEAHIYLLVILWIFISPFFKIKKLGDTDFCISKAPSLKYVLLLIACFQILITIIDLPQIKNIMNMGQDMLADARDNVYTGDNSLITSIPMLNRFNLMYGGAKPICVGISVFLFFCCRDNRKFCLFFLCTCFLSIFHDVVVLVSRGVIVNYAMYIVIVLIFIRAYLSQKTKRLLIVYTLPFIIVAAVFFWTVTISRFGDLAEYMMYKYPGEAMINFSGYLFNDIKGYTHGHAYVLSAFFNDFMTGEEKWNYIENITHVPAFIFYTFVGGFVLEFGKIGTVIIALFFNFIIRKTINSNNPSGIVITIAFAYFYSYGIFLFPLQKYQVVFFVLFLVFVSVVTKRQSSNIEKCEL